MEDRAPFLGRVPDEPRFVEARALLEAPHGVVLGTADDAFVVLDTGFPFGALVGELGDALAAELLAELRDRRERIELLVQAEDLASARERLPGWRFLPATAHHHPAPRELPRPSGAGRHLAPGEPPRRHPALGEDLARELDQAVARRAPMAVVEEDGAPVSFCYGFLATTRFWDVSVDTLEHARRRGHAREAFLTLAHELLPGGQEPVWGSLDDNAASMRLAATLGYRPVAHLAVAVPGPDALDAH